ncbi:hypothetical protein HDEF_0977 [Candidatus Hamiltonella defensa 5AT (Acyrthosiphon pisum)]|uniref:Uncharacterized protein n=1 Tax=Hamiltonella defensa subsp. Acyrthosiphon pisum (strain 5AT) TaxID=572265 RepID=C4K536_HAMD5|nr:hypothetical protein HDEF_0977 [Candidatus Hamiltonella defensa 5AT (Acyrthosiphon pisum)]
MSPVSISFVAIVTHLNRLFTSSSFSNRLSICSAFSERGFVIIHFLKFQTEIHHGQTSNFSP